MTMALAGVLPVSALNLGLGLVPPALQAEVEQLGVDLTRLGAALLGQVDMAANQPNLAALQAILAEIWATLSDMVVPSKLIAGGADFSGDIVAKLAIVDAEIDIVSSAANTLAVGLASGGIAAWCYSGAASGVASVSAGITGGWVDDPDSQVEGLLIATESLSSWGSFGLSINTGPSKVATAGGPPVLTYLGKLGGGQICPGLLTYSYQLNTLLIRLQGLKLNLDYQLSLTAGLNLPDVSKLLELLEELMAEAASLLDNLINVGVDIEAELSGVQARIDVLLALVNSISVQLSAGGLAVWNHVGPASSFGSEIAGVLSGGIPGGTGAGADIRVLALSCAEPAVWLQFGTILGAG